MYTCKLHFLYISPYLVEALISALFCRISKAMMGRFIFCLYNGIGVNNLALLKEN